MTIPAKGPVTQRGTIRSNHLVRGAFADKSTDRLCYNGENGYYETKSHAVCAFDDVLQDYGLYLDRDDLDDFHGRSGCKRIAVFEEYGKHVGYAVLSWHRMPYGNYDFTGRLE